MLPVYQKKTAPYLSALIKKKKSWGTDRYLYIYRYMPINTLGVPRITLLHVEPWLPWVCGGRAHWLTILPSLCFLARVSVAPWILNRVRGLCQWNSPCCQLRRMKGLFRGDIWLPQMDHPIQSRFLLTHLVLQMWIFLQWTPQIVLRWMIKQHKLTWNRPRRKHLQLAA